MRHASHPEVTCVVDARNMCGEGPLWHPLHDAIYWTDINGFTVQRYTPGSGELRRWEFGEPACALSLTTDPDTLLLALGSQVILWSPRTDTRTVLARPEADTPAHRLNDGATDPSGAFWVGSMPNNVAPDGTPQDVGGFTGSLFRVMPDGAVSAQDRGFGITNTLVWSPDQRTFHCGDSEANVIYAYDFDVRESRIDQRRTFFEGFERGAPDGSAMDVEGYVWNCRFGGKCLVRVAPDGRVDRVIELPASNVTNCDFGGPDLRTLYVTTAALGAPDGDEHAGGLFALELDVSGLPTHAFRLAQ